MLVISICMISVVVFVVYVADEDINANNSIYATGVSINVIDLVFEAKGFDMMMVRKLFKRH